LPEEIARTFMSAASGIAVRQKDDGRASLVTATEESETEWADHDDRYAILRDVGRGGMGRVEEVFDSTLGRSVARKILLSELGETAATMLIAEAQTSAQLEHPAIVPVYDLDADETGRPRYTMRYVQGRTLRDVLNDNHTGKQHTPLAKLLGVLGQVCLAIDYAHSKGVIHRDLKPENIMLGDFGEVYVLDWGIAHLAQGSDIIREDIGLVHAGSPGYMAPEQVQSEPITARTDVFALGVILYEMLAGKRPFEDDDVASIVARSTRDFKNAPSLVDPDRIPGAFDTLVVTCLRRDPEMRPPSARFVADAIDAYLDQERVRAEREADADRFTREGEDARALFETLDAEAKKLKERGEAMHAEIPPYESVERKQPAWDLEQHGRQLASEAARALARANAAFIRAIGRVENHAGARKGLAALYYRQFLTAEDAGDEESMAQYLDLARSHDDGPLRLELANQGELIVECSHPEAELRLAKYETKGWLYVLGEAKPIQTHDVLLLDDGSWVVLAKLGDREARFPVRIRRAKRHHLRCELGALATLPKGMILIPGGPFLAPDRAGRLHEHHLPDFAMAELPVTFAEYTQFLDTLDPEECARRIPHDRLEARTFIVKENGSWRLDDDTVEGQAKQRIPPGRELDLAATAISWFDTLAYAAWRSARDGVRYRLPNSLEWDKAARGVDGRAFPMGSRMDPAFAKLRESRAEASQPEPIGAFVFDASPYGVRDLAGGVQDWTSTPLAGHTALPHEPDPERQEEQAIVRGGMWGHVNVGALRAQYRVTDRTGWVGFRLALALEGSMSSLEINPMST
jgi:serine/threonine-protein kinase